MSDQDVIARATKAHEEWKQRVTSAGWPHSPGSLHVVYVDSVLDWLDELYVEHSAALKEIARLKEENQRFREALSAIASPGSTADYGWWTEDARKALSSEVRQPVEGRRV